MTEPADVTNEVFLRGIFGDEWGRAYVVAFSSDPSGDGDRSRWAGNSASRILRSFRPHENQYYTVSLFNDDYADERAGRATRRKLMFDRMFLVLVDDVAGEDDLGDGKKVRASLVRERWGEPSFRLETSPGNEQWGFLFNEPLADRIEAEVLVSEMIARGLTSDGADPGMSGVTRLVRLPGGTNRKAKYGRDGFKCRLRAWNPERRFSPEWLAEQWGFDLKACAAQVREPAARQQEEREPPGEWLPTWDNVLRPEDDEHAAVFGIEDLSWRDGTGSPEEDPLMRGLAKLRLIKERRGGGMFEITCPFVHTHTRHVDDGTARMPNGGISCHHGHCVGRPRREYAAEVGKRLLRLKHDKEALELARVLMPWRPTPYDVRRVAVADVDKTLLDTARLVCAALRRGDDPATALTAAALQLAPLVLEKRTTSENVSAMIGDAIRAAGGLVSTWRAKWAWALEAANRKEAF